MSEGATMSAPAAACDAHQLVHGRVVRDLLLDDDPAMTVVRVLAEADVRDHQHLGDRCLDRPDGALHGRLRIISARSDIVLLLRQSKQQHAADPVGLCGSGLAHRFVDGQIEHAWHRRDLSPHPVALAHEQGQHEHVRRQPRFAHQRAHGL
jgi:hypothetical protein